MKPRRPRDPFQLAKKIGDIATGRATDADPDAGKNPAAVELGRKGGLKGGRATASKMTAQQRRAAASKAAQSRWKKLRNDT